MAFKLDAAALCNMGRVRKNNEDNILFDGKCLHETSTGLCSPAVMTQELRRELCVAVFDGMGGENYGESAAYAAVKGLQSVTRNQMGYFRPEKQFFEALCEKLNGLVLEKARALCTTHMGTTMAALFFSDGYAYSCNLGDSRVYCLRGGDFLQISTDHVQKREGKSKAPLTQHLGIDPEDFCNEPCIVKGELCKGDQYLLCSDGLTDMLTDAEIAGIMSGTAPAEQYVRALVNAALENSGKDNVSVIVCRIS